MHLVSFKEQNFVYAKDQKEYLPLPCHRKDTPEGLITCKWALTWKDRIKLLFTGCVWHQVLTFHQPLQPQLLLTDKPDLNG